MGRSKFPGKPSKSINRKRISVLQLDEEDAAAAETAATTTDPEENVDASTTTTTRIRGDKCDDDDDDDEHNHKGGGAGGAAAGTSGSAGCGGSGENNGRNVNGKGGGGSGGKNEGANGTSGEGGGGGGGRSNASTASDNTATSSSKLSASAKNAENAQKGIDGGSSKESKKGAQGRNGGRRSKSKHKYPAAPGDKDTTNNETAARDDDNKQQQSNAQNMDKVKDEMEMEVAVEETGHTTNTADEENDDDDGDDDDDKDDDMAAQKTNKWQQQQQPQNSNAAMEDEDEDEEGSDAEDEDAPQEWDENKHELASGCHGNYAGVDGVRDYANDDYDYDEDDDDEEDDEDDEDDDNASSSTACSSPTTTIKRATTTTAAAALAFSRCKRDGKFKNLNLAKPEVMLPSSAKLRQSQQQQQQQQPANKLNCPSPLPLASSTPTSPTTTATKQTPANVGSNSTKSAITTTTTTTSSTATTTTNSTKRITNPFAVDGKLCGATDTDDDEAALTMTSSGSIAVDEAINSGGDLTVLGAHSGGEGEGDGDGRGGATAVKTNTKTNEMPSTNKSNNNNSKSSNGGQSSATAGGTTTNSSSMTTTTTTTTTITAASSKDGKTSLSNNNNSNSNSSTTSSGAGSGGGKQKKTVTFKNILETSDDKSAVKKFYNPDNRTPLVSIIKKECMNRPLLYSRSGECIVRPSRLTEILKNNSNIDKLNSLKFRSSHTTTTAAAGASTAASGVGGGGVSLGAIGPATAIAPVFGAARLGCAFGAPPAAFAVEERKHDTTTATTMTPLAFRLNEASKKATAADVSRNEMHAKREQSIIEGQVQVNSHKRRVVDGDGGEHLEHDDDADADADPDADAHEGDNGDEEEVEEQQIVVDKHFVLPKRSTRSSRVIKPNKWLLEDGIICKKVAHVKTKPSTIASASATTSQTTTTPTAVTPTTTTSGNSGGATATKKDQPNYFSLCDYPEPCSTLGIKIGKENNKSAFGGTPFGAPAFGSLKTNNFVLRQPRLQFDSNAERSSTATTTTTTATSTAATTTTTLNSSIPSLTISVPKPLTQTLCLRSPLSGGGTMASTFGGINSGGGIGLLSKCTLGTASSSSFPTCSVCNTPIHSNSSQQPLKYGVPACSACRKFISKISKNSSTLKSSQFHCRGGDGNCIIQPNTKIHIKNFKKVYKERCTSCWLKKCLQTLQLSPGDKLRLTAALPHSLLKQVEAKRERSATDADEMEPDGGMAVDHSPTGLFGAARFKWKSMPDAANESLKLNLKNNLLAENNATFGSSTLLRPPILEKPLFLKSPIIDVSAAALQQQDKHEKQQSPKQKSEEKSTDQPEAESGTQRLVKSKRREKHEKEKDKERTTREREKEREREREPSNANNPKLASNSSGSTSTTTISSEAEANALPVHTKVERSAKAASLSPAAAQGTRSANTVDAATNNSNQRGTITKGSPSLTTPQQLSTNTNAVALPSASTTSASPSTTTTAATTTSATNSSDSSLKRQRIAVKGPRVKHVCRSASIVLGQPLATFGEGEGEDEEDEATLVIAEDEEPTAEEEVEEQTAAAIGAKATSKTTEIVLESSEDATQVSAQTHDTKVVTRDLKTPKPKQVQSQTLVPTEAQADNTKPIEKPATSDNGNADKTSAAKTTEMRQSESAEPPAAKSAKIVATTIEKKEETANATAEKEKIVTSLPLQPSKVVTRNSNTSNINLQISRSVSSYATTFGKKSMRQMSGSGGDANQQSQQQQLLRRKEPQKPKTLISIDFWENYDPAEVCQSGFGLIVTETVAQRALCFLCGSAGLEPLIFCACCCEPYHQYCVMDEYNLKHSSLDDTMLSFMDISTMGHSGAAAAPTPELFNQITNRLNWLCPRCTVCYTCNMSSGSKVKCQKCQKNYHSTCLGTSKRLLGADRPLICVNCLKCKSCSTTKVSKFVGNLPMCTACFKLRKRGNYCPICQRCYDDNDFDLKMMECGNCNHWVHSKCEGLSDEQYNLLSTLPESIEFICKKCARRNEDCKLRAAEWRAAVMEEFKSSLMSVLKLLSKSRQACTLLKLSPRKKVRCTCGNATGAGAHQFSGRTQPKSLQFSSSAGCGERDPLALGSDGESEESISDVYEFKEKSSDEELLPKRCNCMLKTTAYNAYGNSSAYSNSSASNLSLMDIKKKINANDYVSLAEFNYDMINIIQSVNCDELVIAYNEILSEQFPWFQNETKACTDALEEDMFESCSYSMGNSLDGHEEFVEEEQNRGAVIDLPEDIEEVLYSLKPRDDLRTCLFCRKSGEGLYNEESRLLYCGHDSWVHTNCAMWSAEVFEEIDGSLQNVHSAVARGRMIKCTVCGGRGATVGCNVKACGEHYHYSCARNIACAFLTDKTVYCPEHARNALKSNTMLQIETNFEVARPVYVELDRKRKKLLEPSKVQFHIGSLEVKQLGTVLPRFSDTYEAIIPINFLCSRLYWSFKEPWKVVEYTVRTTVQNNYSTLTALDAGRNFTVDHSNPNVSLVQLGLAQIACWHSSLARGDLIDYDAVELRNSTLTKLLPEYLLHSQNSCSAPDDNTEEEPQTNADLLPPEIKEAIFEDLPHELLDGISMLDIFPKFMIYEEMGGGGNSGEGKITAETFINEQSKDDTTTNTAAATTTRTPSSGGGTNSGNCSTSSVQLSDEDTANSSLSKQLDMSNSCSSSNANANANGAACHIEDALLSCTRATATQFKRAMSSTELQRSKAEMLKKTWTKFESASCTAVAAAAIKKRKLSKGVAESVLQSLSQHRTKKESGAVTTTIAMTTTTASHRQTIASNEYDGNSTAALRTKTFTWSAAKRYIEPQLSRRDEKDADAKIKLMQVDGVDDSITEFRIITTDGQFTGNVKCDRCHCTYRNYESFQRHIPTCEALSTSESDSEAASRSSSSVLNGGSPMGGGGGGLDATNIDFSKLGQARGATTATLTSNANSLPFLQAFTQAIPLGNLQANINGIPIANMSNGYQNVQGLQGIQGLQNIQSIPGLQNIQLQSLQTPQALGGGFFISSANPTTSNNDEVQFLNSLQGLTANLNGTYTLAPTNTYSAASLQPAQQQPQLIAVSTSPDGTQQIIQLPAGITAQTVGGGGGQQLLQGINAFQTLQAPPSNEKKIMLPITTTNSKPMKTVGNKTVQQQAAASTGSKNKIKVSSATVKPLQSKMHTQTVTVSQPSAATMQATPITVLNSSGGGGNSNATHLLNQNLLQQMQAAGLATNTAQQQQQPQLLFQTANGQQQPIVMQQLSAPQASLPQNIISFVTTDGSQTPQVQYMTLPSTNDYKPQTQTAPSFITATAQPTSANQFLQGAFLQTDASGNLMLTTTQPPNGLQMLSATPLNIATATPAPPPQAQVIGTLINPQTLQLGGNVIATTTDPQQQQQQLIIGGGATGLEMIAANTGAPQVILSTQPMYYGLETIVQNTVMSSQQFVSTAMPGMLSQNASFSATTTQVFQASKIEPIVDLPTGYVVLNNVDATPAIVQQPQQQQQQPASSQQNYTNTNTTTTTTAATPAELQSNDQQQSIFRLQTTENNNSNNNSNNNGNSTTVTAATVTPTVATANFQYQSQSQQQQQQQQAEFTEPQAQQQQQQQHQQQSAITAKVPPVAQVKRSTPVKATPVAAVTKVQPQQVVNKVIPTTVVQQQPQQQQHTQAPPKSTTNNKQQRSAAAANTAVAAPAPMPMSMTLPMTMPTTATSITVADAQITLTPVMTKPITTTAPHHTRVGNNNNSNSNGGHTTPVVSVFATTVAPTTATTTASTLAPPAATKAMSTMAPSTITTTATTPRKTNPIRPINKAEVKPKVMRTTTTGTVAKQQQPPPVQQQQREQLLQQQKTQLQQQQQQTSVAQQQQQQSQHQQVPKMAMLKPQQQQQQQHVQTSLTQPHNQSQPQSQSQLQLQSAAQQFVSESLVSKTPSVATPNAADSAAAPLEMNASGNKLMEFQQTTDAVLMQPQQHFTDESTVQQQQPQHTYSNALPSEMYTTDVMPDDVNAIAAAVVGEGLEDVEEEEQGLVDDVQHPSQAHALPHSYDCSHQEQQPELPHTQQIEFNSLSLEQVESFPPPTMPEQQQHEASSNILTVTAHTPSNNSNNNNRCLQYSSAATNNSAFTLNNSNNNNNNVPTNIVNPLQQTMQYNNNSSTGNGGGGNTAVGSRPTNRVLPMQQRQEHIAATTPPPLQVKPPPPPPTAAAMPKLSALRQVRAGAKCYDAAGNRVNVPKIYYEADVKKDEQMLHILHSPQHQHQQQQQQQQQVLQMRMHHEPLQETTSLVKALSAAEEHYVEDTLKCDLDLIETETTLSATCQQLQEMVHNNLPRYTGTCLVANEKPKELTPPPEDNAYALNGCNVDALGGVGGNGMCGGEHGDDDCLDDMDMDEEEMDDEEEEDDDMDEEEEVEEEDEDDGFSLKIPTEDGDQEITDSDEPAVKEKICKILDNLTNEECADSLATAATAEAANIELNNVGGYLSGLSATGGNKSKMDACMSQNYAVGNVTTTAAENAAVAAAASEYISQMAAKMSAQMPSGSLEVIGTNFDLQKLTPKHPTQIDLDTTLTSHSANAMAHSQSDEAAARASAQNMLTSAAAAAARKASAETTPPPAAPPPHRDPKKISGPHLLYEIQSEDGFTYKSASIADIWEKVFEAVQVARRAHGLSPLPEGPLADMAGVQMMGLKTNALKYLIEQLPGVERCTKYTPKYHKRTAAGGGASSSAAANGSAAAAAGTSSGVGILTTTSPTPTAGSVGDLCAMLDYASDQDDLQENPYDCARCEPYATRSEYDMFSWLASRHRKQPIQVFVPPSDTELIPRRGTGSNLPMAMKYRTLKETYKDYVGVFRSHIHGRGLYCTKDIEAGEMVIEYAGELIRSTLTDKRERNYNSRGIGCYMFKIDDNLVVDATMRGNAARFINHSCEPNCYSKVVDILGHKHIIIFALRRIVQGEELTYDYKFPFEDEKIPCSCGSKRCRKYLN